MHTQPYLHGMSASEQQRLEFQTQLLGAAEFLPPVSAGMHILEVGCGTGAIARAVAGHDPSVVVVGVDREAAQLETARRLAAAAGLSNLQFLQGDANHLDLPEGSFDAAYCRFLLEHLREPWRVVQEMSRVVKPGGWICAYEWEPDCFSIYPDSPTLLQQAENEYQLLLSRTDAFVLHGFCRAVGGKDKSKERND